MYEPEEYEPITVRMLNRLSENSMFVFKTTVADRLSILKTPKEKLKFLNENLAERALLIQANKDWFEFLPEVRIQTIQRIAISMCDSISKRDLDYTKDETAKLKLKSFYKKMLDDIIRLARELQVLYSANDDNVSKRNSVDFPIDEVGILQTKVGNDMMVYKRHFRDESGLIKEKHKDAAEKLQNIIKSLNRDIKDVKTGGSVVAENTGEILDYPKDIIEYSIFQLLEFRDEIITDYIELRNYFNDRLITNKFPEAELKRMQKLIQAMDEQSFLNRQAIFYSGSDKHITSSEAELKTLKQSSERVNPSFEWNFDYADLVSNENYDDMVKNFRDSLVKWQFIESSADARSFRKIFQLSRIKTKINWIGNLNELRFLLRQMKSIGLITKSKKINEIATKCFLIKSKEFTAVSFDSNNANPNAKAENKLISSIKIVYDYIKMNQIELKERNPILFSVFK